MSHITHVDESGAPSATTATSQASFHALTTLQFNIMRNDDLPEVEAIERDVYEHPWSMGNFIDSLASGYETWVLRDAQGTVAGYFLLMLAPDDVHLLNITVRRASQGRGVGRMLLDHACNIARSSTASAVLLEVRPSNPNALAVYRHVGFRQIGVRNGYYPAASQKREDAIVMRLAL